MYVFSFSINKTSEQMKGYWVFTLFCYFLFNEMGLKMYGQTKQNLSTRQKSVADSIYTLAAKYDDAGNSNKALTLFENCLPIYKNIKQNQKVGDCYTRIGLLHNFQGDYSKALFFYKKSFESYTQAGHKKGVSGVLNNMAGVYYNLGNYPQAVEYLRKAAVIQEEIGDEKMVATVTENIGAIYSKVKDYNNAMRYINKAYSIFKKINDKKGIAKMLIEIGYISMGQGNFDNALKEFNEALIIAEKEKDIQLELEVLSYLGELFYKKGDFQKAQYYYNRCLTNAEKVSNLLYKSRSRIAIGNTLHQLGKHKESVDKCKAGLQMAEKLGAVSVKKDACECLYNSYKSLGNDQLALRYYEKVNAFADSLHSEETSNKMMNMEFQKQQMVDSIAYVNKQNLIDLKHKEEVQKKEKQRNIIIVSLGIMLLVASGLWSSLSFVKKSREALRIEKDRSEELLLNILPSEIADELKEKGSVNTREFDLVSILFTDFKSFTQTAEKMTPQSLVEEINVCFKAFDYIAEKYQIEKIKTIGDAYMAAGGIPHPFENSTKNIVLAGLEMQEFVTKRVIENEQKQIPFFEMRLGIHAGPIVAGIVGIKKFQYDVWGDAVNTASRIESNGMVGKVNISETLYDLIKDDETFTFEYRGNIHAKGKGEIKMYFVERNASQQTNPKIQVDELVLN
jgi:adenylate cyclase